MDLQYHNYTTNIMSWHKTVLCTVQVIIMTCTVSQTVLHHIVLHSVGNGGEGGNQIYGETEVCGGGG